MAFAELVRAEAERRGLALAPARHPEPLAGLDYPLELEVKRAALETFWHHQRLHGQPEPIVAAAQPRGYRTTTKRQADEAGGRLTLSFPGAAAQRGVAGSALDPPEHLAVYRFLLERLVRPPAKALAQALNHAVVRGQPGALAVILNVVVFDARVVRAAKLLADALQEAPLGVRSAFLYLDPSGSDYYLEARRPAAGLSFKRLFGPDWLQVEVEGARLRFPPVVFSQVNGAMLPVMIATARGLLAPLEGAPLLDLYCGYGLFSLTVGRHAAEVTGVDHDGPAIQAARGNAAHVPGAGRVRFLAGRIDRAFLAERLRPPVRPELLLLDPPRGGTAPDVVPALAARRPLRVVHVGCGIDELPREIEAWTAAGYQVQRVVPLDLFAGTAALETFLLLDSPPVPRARRSGPAAGERR